MHEKTLENQINLGKAIHIFSQLKKSVALYPYLKEYPLNLWLKILNESGLVSEVMPLEEFNKSGCHENVKYLFKKLFAVFGRKSVKPLIHDIIQLNSHMDEKDLGISIQRLSNIVDKMIEKLRGYRLRDTQKAAILCTLNESLISEKADANSKGVLQQINTGEGKTLIIAVMSIILALMKVKVSIVTSSSVLAKREIESKNGCADLYQAFGIKVGHVCYDLKRKRSEMYSTCDVIYGDLTTFQSDYLQDTFLLTNVLNGWSYDVVIVDEVDSMLLDNGFNTLYLAHEIPELKLLQPVLTKIWQFVNLLEFIKNAEIAYNMEEGIQYQIETVSNIHTQELETRIIIIDPDTGVDLPSTQWAHGLHQFLQLKHGLALTPISTKAIYVSNVTFFKKFSRIYGFTGTLGTEIEKDTLKELYQVKCDVFSSSFNRCFNENAPIVTKDENSQCIEIFKSLQVMMQHKRSVLIIGESIKSITNMRNNIKDIAQTQLQQDEAKPFLYSKIYKRVSEKLEFADGSIELPPATIIFATNLAGRGTDIKISKCLRENGGLHVILAFLPQSIRIEKQAFGRAARNGEPGTAQLIFWDNTITDDETHEKIIELKNKRNLKERQKNIIDEYAAWLDFIPTGDEKLEVIRGICMMAAQRIPEEPQRPVNKITFATKLVIYPPSFRIFEQAISSGCRIKVKKNGQKLTKIEKRALRCPY
uniref:Chloroplast protein-transporting ATPase n=1 Tax=Panagrolaimus davidi TaxID=227884 RepID=A0A914QUZ4_9BILA